MTETAKKPTVKLYKTREDDPIIIEVKNSDEKGPLITLKELQNLVGGNIEFFYPRQAAKARNLDLIVGEGFVESLPEVGVCNDVGKLIGLEINYPALGACFWHEALNGDIVFLDECLIR